MVREHQVSPDDFIYPIFAVEGSDIKEEVPSMPGVFHFSLDRLDEEVDEVVELGIPSIILFGVPQEKDACGSSAYADEGIVQRAIRQVKQRYPDLYVMADTCLCQYTDHGHCGVVENGEIVNDESLQVLARTAVSSSSGRGGSGSLLPI